MGIAEREPGRLSGKSGFWDILARRDPHGYYVIPIKPEGRELIEDILRQNSDPYAKILEGRDVILVRVRSRSVAEKIVRAAARRGLIAEVEEIY